MDWLSRSVAALSYASLRLDYCSSRSPTFSPRSLRTDRSSKANTSQSCIDCLAVSYSSRRYAACSLRSSRSLIQFCWERFARFRRLDNSFDCAFNSDVKPSHSADFAVYCSCRPSFCSSSSSMRVLACARSSYVHVSACRPRVQTSCQRTASAFNLSFNLS